MKENQIREIHDSLLHGKLREMVVQIDEYGVYDFWEDYTLFLLSLYHCSGQYRYFQDATIGYFRVKNR